MLWRASTIMGSGIRARDGSIGSITDLLFEDTSWTVRWVVVDTGSWLPGRQVLLPPSALGRPKAIPQEFPVDLTRKQVEDSPGLGTDAPVSRQLEASTYGPYGWAPYWYTGFAAYPGYAPPLAAPAAVPPAIGGLPQGGASPDQPGDTEQPSGDPSLRSMSEVTGYYIRATDGDIGHIEDFLVEDQGWDIRYVMVDTRNWWPGRKVLVAPRWFRDVSWAEQQIHVDLTRAEVEKSPEFDPSAVVERSYEEQLHRHYGQRFYWE